MSYEGLICPTSGEVFKVASGEVFKVETPSYLTNEGIIQLIE
jgi:hypothetical protein